MACVAYMHVFKNGLIQETRDFILLSYDLCLINNEDFILDHPSYISQNLDLPLRRV